MAVHGHSRCMACHSGPFDVCWGRFSLVETHVFMQSLILCCCIQNEQLKSHPDDKIKAKINVKVIGLYTWRCC